LEVSGQLSCTGHFTPRERAPTTHWIGGWVGLRVGLDAVEKSNIPLACRESNTGRPARGLVLCWLIYLWTVPLWLCTDRLVFCVFVTYAPDRSY